jgi:hypothetical protein
MHKIRNKNARQNDERITFDPSLTCRDNLAECFRIFIDPDLLSNSSAQRTRTHRRNPTCDECVVHISGVCLNSGKQNASCGSGIWFGQNNQNNVVIRVSRVPQLTQTGEIAAVVTHVSGTSLTARYRVVALLYGLGLQVTILGPLYYTALSHSHPLMEGCRWTGQSCVLSV